MIGWLGPLTRRLRLLSSFAGRGMSDDGMGRARFYFLLPTSENFRGSLPTKPVYMYCALYELMIIEVIARAMEKMNIIVIPVSFKLILIGEATMEHLANHL